MNMRRFFATATFAVAAVVIVPASADMIQEPAPACSGIGPCNDGAGHGTCFNGYCCTGCVLRDVTGAPIACYANGSRTTSGTFLCGIEGDTCSECGTHCKADGTCA